MIISFLGQVKADIIDAALAKGMNATGRTLGSLEELPIGETGGELRANENIIFLEDGRGPTKPGAPAGNPTLLEAITEWVEAKGVGGNPYAITKTIHKHGTKLYRMGGKSGVLSIPLREERITDLFNRISENLSYNTASEIFKPINNLNTK